IDFSDEGDVPDDLLRPALSLAATLAREISDALADAKRGERLREGFVVAIAGPPNAGKSTLLNRIARRDAAIVSPHAGTTRDVIEVHLDLDGYPVTLLDTAGIRETDDPVEQEGVTRAKARAADADLVLWVVDAADPAQAAVMGSLPASEGATAWLLRNKIDRAAATDAASASPDFARTFSISASTGAGMDPLLAALARHVENYFSASEPALVTRARQRLALEDALAALRRVTPTQGEELIAEELRLAARALGRLVGAIDVEDILDVIFRDFCIGK
ncbi:MAG: tRNA modification GTPase, partial [Pseudorhodoplanes sp.]